MSASADAMTVALNAGFQDRVRYFLMKASLAVLAEGAVANHTARAAYASAVIGGTASVLLASIACLTNGAVAAAGFEVTDGDLEFTVNSVFNALAGVSS